MLLTRGFSRVRKAQERHEPFQRLYIAAKTVQTVSHSFVQFAPD